MSRFVIKPDVMPADAAVVSGRRRFLKTAAATSPIIATLPNGAAFANYSASQCVMDSRDSDPAGAATSTADGFYRVAGQKHTFTTGDVPPTATKVAYSSAALPQTPTIYWDETGTSFDPTTGGWSTPPTSEAVLLLVLFQPDSSGTGNPGQPNSVTDCIPGTVGAPCIFPVTQRTSGNMGIAATCLLSVNPGAILP